MLHSIAKPARRREVGLFLRRLAWTVALGLLPFTARAINAIQAENLLPGTPQATWDITGVGDPTIQGFATDISVNRGGTITFKISTDAASYHIDIYRLGWYGGDGARLQGTGEITATLPQTQPAPLTEAASGLVDCGNWAESAQWQVPPTAVSGIYIARLERDDTNGASHIAFIVRDDAATGGLLFKTSDATWQAYNGYGGNSLYVGSAPRSNGNAAKVSYNRPFSTRGGGGGSGGSEDWLFHSEYPMLRWLEANGYDVTYTTDLDVDRDPARLLQHQVFLSVGHDEYWSAGERAAVEAARAAGVHLAFFSGNEVYWKTRWEPSIDVAGTPHRTMVCYKEGTSGENVCGTKCDPLANAWTGLWRAGCEYLPTADGCKPENALSGQISWVGSTGALTVPDTYKNLRFWRNTAVASLGTGQTLTLPNSTLGYEWDPEQFPASYPPGRIKMSATSLGGQAHHLSLYRHASGALVFGAGTVQWSWGLDATHDNPSEAPSLAMQQATVNLLADMGAQPETIQPGLVLATASADALPPSSVITSPLQGATLPSGVMVTLTGTATDNGGGALAGVEVSVDGGTTWQVASGTGNWARSWTPSAMGPVTIMSRGFDDSGNMESTAGGPLPNVITVTIGPPPPPPTEGPGGPILVISSAANPFSRYPVEILRTEGLNAFTAMDLSLVTPAVLSSYDVVVLGECVLSPADVTMLSDWTDAGGTLVAFRPDAQLAPLLGLTPAAGTLSNAYLLVNTASGPGAGIVSQTMQFHGTADLYTLSGATAVATLYSDATTSTPYPAVTTRSVGANGGRALAFTYDLARSVVYTRQGNPAWAGTKRDGEIEPIRSDDMFFGAAAGDPQPDWIDFTKIAIPQADEQQRLLANAIIQGNLHRKPLPRFWYLPKGLKAAVVMTGDNHGDGGMASRFEIYRTQSAPGCSPEDWECIRATGYLYLGSALTPAQATFYQNLGFEVSLHVNTNCARFTPSEYEAFVSAQTGAFASQYPDIPLVSNRNHCISFPDWSTTPEVEAAHGIRFDTNYYYWPASWVQDRAGLFTGSGMPMRFAKLDGTIVDCFQAVTQMPDEAGESFPAFCDALLDRALGAEGYYGAFTTNMHFDSSPHAGSDAIVASAQARGVPVVSAKQMLDWLDGRNGSSFSGLSWSGNQLTFSIAVGSGARNLRAMLPFTAAVGQLATLTRGGDPVPFSTETIKGIAYAFFPAEAGSYAATYLVDETQPIVSDVVATPTSGTTATVTWTTDEPADSRVDYGTSPGSLPSSASNAALVTSHSVALTGLDAGASYHFRVTSADAASNSATFPASPAAPLTFTMPSVPCFADQTAVDFELGTVGSGTSIAMVSDGEVILSPALHAEFSGVSLPGDWVSAAWGGGGTATVSGGSLVVDGAQAHSSASYGSGRSLEYRATYTPGNFQNIGFAGDGDFNNPWIVIGEGTSTNGVYARMDTGDQALLSTATLGSSHLYRIDWTPTGFDFWIDGVLVHSFSRVVSANLVAIISDFPVGGAALSVDWVRLTPYAASGSFTSRVFDSGQATDWGVTTWSATTPGGTSVALFARGGDTSVPDGTWSAFLPLSNGGSLGLHARYLQYRADLATGTPGATPVLADVAIRCDGTPDTSPPIISNVVATPGAGGTTADVTWTTNEAATSHVDYGTSPGSLSSSSSSSSLVTSHLRALTGLTPSTTYYYRVTSADAVANSATEPDPPAAPLSFTTPAAPPSLCAQDVTAADFSAGTLAGTRVAQSGDGEVTLSPSLDVDFSGTSLPAGWEAYDWPFDAGVGTASVSGGLLTVDGARANPEPYASSPGTVLEFVATFSGDAFQHAGFGAGSHLPSGEVFNTTPWAMFSTGSGGALKARTNNSSGSDDFTIPGSFLGAAHAYRIEWAVASVAYYIDGTLVHTSALAVSGSMRPAASDLSVGGGTVTVDRLSATPYVPSGTFTSRVHDAGAAVSWDALSWSASLPPGTTLAMEVRRGDTPAPDGTWSGFAPVPASGGSIAGISRYLQYRATLATSDPASTPSLADVSATCSACSGPAPDAIADLAVSPQAPNPAGLRPIAITFTAPGGAIAIEVYRAPFGGHPRYDEAGGSLPATPAYPPGSPWQLTAVTASGQSDLPPSRDQWHYVAFWRNSCGVTSAVSNRPPGVLDYRLGDVSDGVTACAGDGSVQTADLSLLGAHYGASITGSEDYACLDVGPTTDSWITGRPLTDGIVEFEDLLMFALEFDSPPAAPAVRARPALAARDELRLGQPATVTVGERFDVAVQVSGAGTMQAVSLRLVWDAARVRPVGMTPGAWLQAQGGVAYAPRHGSVDAALLGRRESGLAGEGTLAVVTFEALVAGAPMVELGSVSARDRQNRAIVPGGTAGAPPAALLTAFENVSPNPFTSRATMRFSLANEGPVELSIYSVDGRRVRTVLRGTLSAGSHSYDWDRRSDAGARVEPGLYLVRLTTRTGRFTHKLAVVH